MKKKFVAFLLVLSMTFGFASVSMAAPIKIGISIWSRQ